MEVSDNSKKVGIIRHHSRQWQYGTFNDGEYPSDWVVLFPAPFSGVVGIAEAIEKAKSFLQ